MTLHQSTAEPDCMFLRWKYSGSKSMRALLCRRQGRMAAPNVFDSLRFFLRFQPNS